jgi:hypothetical protein
LDQYALSKSLSFQLPSFSKDTFADLNSKIYSIMILRFNQHGEFLSFLINPVDWYCNTYLVLKLCYFLWRTSGNGGLWDSHSRVYIKKEEKTKYLFFTLKCCSSLPPSQRKPKPNQQRVTCERAREDWTAT